MLTHTRILTPNDREYHHTLRAGRPGRQSGHQCGRYWINGRGLLPTTKPELIAGFIRKEISMLRRIEAEICELKRRKTEAARERAVFVDEWEENYPVLEADGTVSRVPDISVIDAGDLGIRVGAGSQKILERFAIEVQLGLADLREGTGPAVLALFTAESSTQVWEHPDTREIFSPPEEAAENLALSVIRVAVQGLDDLGRYAEFVQDLIDVRVDESRLPRSEPRSRLARKFWGDTFSQRFVATRDAIFAANSSAGVSGEQPAAPSSAVRAIETAAEVVGGEDPTGVSVEQPAAPSPAVRAIETAAEVVGGEDTTGVTNPVEAEGGSV